MDEETEIFRSNLHTKDDTPRKQQSWTIAHLSQLLPMLWPPSQVAPQLATDSHNVSNLQEGAKIIAPISQKSKLSHPEDNLDRLSRSTSIQLRNISQERHLHQSSPHSSDFLLHVQLREFFCVNALDHLLSKSWDADCKHFSLDAFQLPQQEEEKKKKERKMNKKKALEGREDDEDEGKAVKGGRRKEKQGRGRKRGGGCPANKDHGRLPISHPKDPEQPETLCPSALPVQTGGFSLCSFHPSSLGLKSKFNATFTTFPS